jgi:hypothetical protein
MSMVHKNNALMLVKNEFPLKMCHFTLNESIVPICRKMRPTPKGHEF